MIVTHLFTGPHLLLELFGLLLDHLDRLLYVLGSVHLIVLRGWITCLLWRWSLILLGFRWGLQILLQANLGLVLAFLMLRVFNHGLLVVHSLADAL